MKANPLVFTACGMFVPLTGCRKCAIKHVYGIWSISTARTGPALIDTMPQSQGDDCPAVQQHQPVVRVLKMEEVGRGYNWAEGEDQACEVGRDSGRPL